MIYLIIHNLHHTLINLFPTTCSEQLVFFHALHPSLIESRHHGDAYPTSFISNRFRDK